MPEDITQKTNVPQSSPVCRHLLFWPIFLGGLVIDLWSKKAVFDWLLNKGQDGFSLIGQWVTFQLALNDGAAFGIAKGQQWLLVPVSSIALIVVIGIFLFGGSKCKIIDIALALFAAGISGNLYDRLKDGQVRDFINVMYWPGKYWPAFNVADSMLCIAVGLLILSSFFNPQSCQKPAPPQK
jgi:signal peptidase II